MQTWRRRVLLWQQTTQGTSTACVRCSGKNYQCPPCSCSIMTRGSPSSLPSIAHVQLHRNEQRRWNAHGNMASQRASKIRRPKLLTDETWTEWQSKLACNSRLSLCKACLGLQQLFLRLLFWELFLCSHSIYYTIKTDGEKCSSLRWEGFIWNTK